ncbi:hypothetical protein JCM18899A_27290 [Nocardioides sp. AN3]
MWVSAWVSIPPVISSSSGCVSSIGAVPFSRTDGIGTHRRSGGQHSDEDAAKLLSGHAPSGRYVRPRTPTDQTQGTKPVDNWVKRPGGYRAHPCGERGPQIITVDKRGRGFPPGLRDGRLSGQTTRRL